MSPFNACIISSVVDGKALLVKTGVTGPGGSMPPPPFAASGGFSIQCKTMRHPNEDRFTIVEALSTADASVGFFAVYDGHCGDACSAFLADTLHNRVRESPAFASGDYKQALADGLLSTERTYHMQVIENEKAGVVDENPDDDGPKRT